MTGGRGGRARVFVLSLGLALALPTLAAAREPVSLSVKPLVGGQDQLSLLLATVCSDGPVDAFIEVGIGWNDQRVYREPIHAPAGRCTRQVVQVIHRFDGDVVLRGQDGAELARTPLRRHSWTSWRHGVVLDSRLRGAVAGGDYVDFSLLPADLVIPPNPAAWDGIEVVLTSDRTLSDVDPSIRSAVRAWLTSGGVLVVAADHDGEVERVGTGAIIEAPVDESFQARLPGILQRSRWVTRPTSLRPGTDLGRDSLRWSRFDAGGNFSTLALIDPNARHPPSTGLSWVLLLAYVAVVGPVSYRWLTRRGRPILALASVPACAACVMVALGAHALSVKGTKPTFAARAVVELVSGERLAAVERVAGLVSPHTGSLHVEGSAGAVLGVLDSNRVRPPNLRATEGSFSERKMVFDSAPLAMWDTLLVYEGAYVDLGGTVTVTRVPDGLQIHNGLHRRVRTARLSLTSREGEFHQCAIGDLAPDASVVFDGSCRPPPDGLWQRPRIDFGAVVAQTLEGRIDPVLPAFVGFARDAEETWLQVALP